MVRAGNNILNAIGIVESKIARAKKLLRARKNLVEQRDKCIAAVSKCEQRIADLLGIDISSEAIDSFNGNGKKRGPKLGTKRFKQQKLSIFVHKVMKPGKTCTVVEIEKAIRKIGYKTHQKNSQHFRSTIGAVLREDPRVKHGKKRGTYILKPAAVKRVKKEKKKVSEVKPRISLETQPKVSQEVQEVKA